MFDLGTQELIVIFIVAFLVFGPKKLPELGRTLGKGLRELKIAMRGITESFEEAESDVTDELKEAKNNLEDSIYKSVESNFDNTDSGVNGKNAEQKDNSMNSGNKDKEKKPD